jgi:hypothetical protein
MAKKPEDEIALPDFGFDLGGVPLPKALPKEPLVFEGLSEEDVLAVKAEFDKQQAEDKKKAARKKLMERLLREQRESELPAQEQVEIQIALPPFACTREGYGDIMIDGTAYMNGQTYVVPRSKAEGLREIMQRSWHHEDITTGHRNPNAYQRPRGDNVSATRGHQPGAFLRF